MKELTIEEKAKAYDEAIEKARQLCAYPTSKPFISDLQYLFPALAESEDEKIRKDIISYVEQAIAAGYGIISKERKEIWIAWLEKQGEQKHIIIPKFRVGDEICWKGNIDNNDTIAEICDGYYLNPLGNRMDMSYTDTNFELVKHEIVKE